MIPLQRKRKYSGTLECGKDNENRIISAVERAKLWYKHIYVNIKVLPENESNI